MQEIVYCSEERLDFPLHEGIFVTSEVENIKEKHFLISNSNKVSCEVVANEIDFYIKNTQDSIDKKIINIKKLYDIALTRFDLAQDISYEQKVENRVLLIANSSDSKDFIKNIEADWFDLFHIEERILKSISGHIGSLSVVVDDGGEDTVLNVDQIVWFDIKEEGLKQSGCFNVTLTTINEIILKLRENIGNYSYKKFTTYDENICQYHHRKEEICAKCEEVCPTVSIIKDDTVKELNFSQIDCHGCGGCISVCPSGALDYAPINNDAIFELSKEFKGYIPLIIPNKMDISNLELALKENILPFKIDGEKFLHESSFLTILQQSGAQILFFTDFISKGSGEAIKILNEIYLKKYGKKAIYVAMNETELKEFLKEVDFIDNSYFTYNQEGMQKRENFAIRLKHIVGNDNLGIIKTNSHIHYAKVEINEANCTLCLSCVGACNVGALSANSDDFTLRLNPSICTACSYCEFICPEKNCISINQDIIELNPSWFTQNIVAKDVMFKCVECNKEFATTKSIEKIANIMKPIFKDDEVKIKTLYCCDSCKPKVMFRNDVSKNQFV